MDDVNTIILKKKNRWKIMARQLYILQLPQIHHVLLCCDLPGDLVRRNHIHPPQMRSRVLVPDVRGYQRQQEPSPAQGRSSQGERECTQGHDLPLEADRGLAYVADKNRLCYLIT